MIKIEMEKKGFIPVMLTPFKENGEIDYRGLTSLTELYLKSGVSGLFANCLSSEMFELTPEERISVTKHIIGIVDSHVPVVATGTFGGTVSVQADFIKQIFDTGTDAVILISNMLASEDQEDIVFDERVFELFDKTGDIPLGFYECPDPYKRQLSAMQLHNFVKTGRVIYHKDTCLDIEKVKAKLNATRGYNFGLYDAYIGHAVESLKAGASGLSCIQGNYFPELIVWMCENYNIESLETEVSMVQQVYSNHMELMHQVYPTVAKYFLTKRGLNISSFTRRKVGDFSNEIKNNIDFLYDELKGLCDTLGLNVVDSNMIISYKK